MPTTSLFRVDREARRLLERVGVSAPAVPVEKVAEALGLEVVYQRFDDDLSGLLVKEGGKSTIGINACHAKTRQRFSLAHEIAHFWLAHPGDMFVDKGATVVLFRDGRAGSGTSLHEMEANRFAAALLMPADFLIQSLGSMDEADAADPERLATSLAREYHVSPQAMRFRLSALGLFAAEK